jgi:hypothetical protein
MAKRESFGMKPEQTNRVDFGFYVEDDVVSIVVANVVRRSTRWLRS